MALLLNVRKLSCPQNGSLTPKLGGPDSLDSSISVAYSSGCLEVNSAAAPMFCFLKMHFLFTSVSWDPSHSSLVHPTCLACTAARTRGTLWAGPACSSFPCWSPTGRSRAPSLGQEAPALTPWQITSRKSLAGEVGTLLGVAMSGIPTLTPHYANSSHTGRFTPGPSSSVRSSHCANLLFLGNLHRNSSGVQVGPIFAHGKEYLMVGVVWSCSSGDHRKQTFF